MSQEDDYKRIERELLESKVHPRSDAPKTTEELLAEHKAQTNRTLGQYLDADVLELYRERAARKAMEKKARERSPRGQKVSQAKGLASTAVNIVLVGVVIFMVVIFFEAMKGMRDKMSDKTQINLNTNELVSTKGNEVK